MKNARKIFFGILAGLCFAVSAAYAIKGGPQYPSATNLIGTYAGVLIPASSPTATPSSSISPTPTPTPTPDCAANAIGVFSVGVPQNGLATGSFVMFAQGRRYVGTINAVADSGTGSLKGILHGTLNFTVTFPDGGTTLPVTATANGKLNSRIVNSSSQTGTTTLRVKGTAAMHIDQGHVTADTLEPIPTCQSIFKVRGFKQSDTVTTTASPAGG